MKNRRNKNANHPCGSVLVLAVLVIVLLTLIGMGLLTTAYGMRIRAIRLHNETAAMLAAEAGYEKGIFWMNRQSDVMDSLANNSSGASGTLNFADSSCTYTVQFHDYIGGMPIFQVVSTGSSGDSQRVVDVYVAQVVSGWDMAKCRIPAGTNSTNAVNFVDGEILDIPIHINKYNDSPDKADIYITGSPDFRQRVEMGESRKTSGGSDKYSSIINLFDAGIYFSQPDVRITDKAAAEKKITRFRDSTNPAYRFTPVANAPVSNPIPAVQLEFYVSNGVGKVRITNNCTISTFSSVEDYDYMINPSGNGNTYMKYKIYASHYHDDTQTADIKDVAVTSTYVTQNFNGQESQPGGQIYVNGNVIIGSSDPSKKNNKSALVLQGKLTIVATGNIWIGDSIMVDGGHDNTQSPYGGMPLHENPNILGLIAGGVIKVIDPGLSSSASDVKKNQKTYKYKAVGNGSSQTSPNRTLPDPTIIEAAVTVGGGGWGAENVGDRKEYNGNNDFLILRGSICEAVRGVVGLTNSDGYIKRYYLDKRLLEGILPGNIWFSGKYIPAPAGWSDYRPTSN